MKASFTIVLIFLSILSYSQETKKFEKYSFKKRFSLTWAPYSFVDPNPRLRIGIEYNFTEKESFNIDFGFANSIINHVVEYENLSDFYNFMEVRPQFKRMIYNGYDNRIYLAIEIFISTCQRDFFNSHFYPSNTHQPIRYEYAQVKRIKNGGHFIMGWQFYLFDVFLFDMYGGIGLAHRTIKYNYVENGYISQEEYYEESLFNPFLHEGERILPNLALGLKIGIINSN